MPPSDIQDHTLESDGTDQRARHQRRDEHLAGLYDLQQTAGATELLLGDKLCRCGCQCRPPKSAKGPTHEHGQVDVPELQPANQEQQYNGQSTETGPRVAEDHGPPSVPTIYQCACEWP